MKYIPSLICTAISGLFFMLAVNSPAQSAQQGVATVVRVQGGASYSLGDGQWHPLVAGKTLTAGAVISTTPDGMVDVVLGQSVAMPQAAPAPDKVSYAADPEVRGLVAYKPSAEQNVVRLLGGTVLAIDKLTVSDTGLDTVSDTELDLQKGKIFASVKKSSAASQYFIKIPNGIAGVRGTFLVLGADGTCGVSGQSGHSVVLSLKINGQLTTVTIDPGYFFNPATGQVTMLSDDLVKWFVANSAALQTLYWQIFSFSFDRTLCHVSPFTVTGY